MAVAQERLSTKINNVCNDCGGVLESPVEIGHDDLLCSGRVAVTLYRRYCRACRSYWLHLEMVKVNNEGEAVARPAVAV